MISLECECGNRLTVLEVRLAEGEGEAIFEVEPCRSCIHEASDDAYEDGRGDGYYDGYDDGKSDAENGGD